MMEKTIKVNDNLYDYAAQAKEEVKDELVNYIKDNYANCELVNVDELECLIQDIEFLDYPDNINDSGAIDQIVDSNVPIYNYDIDTCFFLHKNEIEEAYENMGIGDNPLENSGMTAIWCYIYQEVNEAQDELLQEAIEEVVEELRKDNADLPEDD